MALGLRLLSVGALILASASAWAEPPKVLVLPYQQLSKKMPDDLGEATTTVVTKEMSHGGISVIRADDVTGGPPAAKEKGSSSDAPTGDPQAGTRAEQMIVEAKNAMEDSDFEGAVKTLKKASKLLEENADAVADLRLLAEAYLQLGVAYFRDGLEEEGDEMLTRAIHLDPDRTLSESDYPPIFIKIYERGRFNVLRRPRAQIEVKAKAGAQVLFDGRNLGKAPIVLKDALPGEHWVRIERPGEAPQIKKIQARGKTTLVVEFEGGEGAKDEAAPAGVLGAIARNQIGAEHVKQLAGAGKRAGADFVMFGAMFTTDTAYQVRTAYVRVKDGAVGRLLDVAFDLDMLSAEIEVFKLAEDAKKQTEGTFARPVSESSFALAPDLKSAPAKRDIIAGKGETKMSTAIAAPAPIKPPESLYAAAGEAAVEPAADGGKKKPAGAATAPPPKPQVLPKDEIAASGSKSASSPVTAATVAIETDEEKSGSNWWIWVLVGVAAAGAVAGGGYAIAASQGSDDAQLQVRW